MNKFLIYPELPDTFWSFKHALKLAHKRDSFSSPWVLLMVAAIDLETLQEGHMKILRTIYSPESYYPRRKMFIAHERGRR